MKQKKVFLFLSFFLFCSHLYPTIKGSQTQLSVEPFYTFPASDTDNIMLGFGWFKNGFALEDATTTCSFDSVFPVSGDIYLNGGNLYLAGDLILRNMTSWCTSGNIYGDNYLVDFCSSVTGLGSVDQDQVFTNAQISINSDLIVSGSVTFCGECMVDGNGKRILLGEDGCLLIDSRSTVTFKDIYIDGIAEGKICCLDDSSEITLDDVRWIQDGDYSFTKGSIRFFNNVDFAGSHTFFYQSCQTSTVDTHSFWNIFQGLRLSIGRSGGLDSPEPLYFADATSVMKLENCCLSVTSSGMRLTRGLMILDRGVEMEVHSTDSSHGLIVGDGSLENDMEFRFHPGARVLFSKGHIVYDNIDPTSFRSRSGEATFARTDQSIFYLNRDVQLKGLILDTHPNSQLYVADEKILDYINCRVLYPGIEFELGGTRYNDYTNLMKGGDEMFLIRGTLTPYTYVQNANNVLHGNGDVSGKIILQDSDAGLTLNVNGVFSNDINLNGGTVTLEHDALFSQNAIITGPGTIDLGAYTLGFGITDLSVTDSINWTSNGGSISLNSQIELSGTWTFNGDCTLDGGGQTLILKPGGKIVVAMDSTLVIKHLQIKGIKENNVWCACDDCSLVLDNVLWCQEGDYDFPLGSILFKNENTFEGAYTFSYESSQTSTIQKNSRWHVCGDMTLAMGRKEAVNYVEPLYFEDKTSTLKLNKCTFIITASGMRLTKGKFSVSHDVLLEVNSTGSTNGLIFGDGILDNDIHVDIYPGAALHCVKGHLVVDEMNPEFFSLSHGNAKVIRQAGSIFYVNRDMNISNLIIDTDLQSSMIVTPGKTISYNNCTIETVYADFSLTGMRGNDYVNFLMGNGDVFMHRGVLPAYTYVWNTNNTIRGNGSISGAIVLQNAAAQARFNLNGDVLTNVTLNGGTAVLDNDLHITQDNIIVGPGSVELGDNSLYLGSQDKTWPGSVSWDGDVGRIHLNSNLSLLGTWTCNGTCIINGHGNTLDLSSVGALVVAAGAELTLKNMRIKGVSGNNIRCMDDLGRIHLYDVAWVQDGNFSFTQGSISFEHQVDFSGTYTFAYESGQTSTIQNSSRWAITDGMRLEIGRKEAINYLEPIYFDDRTSILKLNNCTFAITESGIRLTKGTFAVSHDVMLEVNSTSSSTGLIFGDGTDEEDINVNIYPGAALHCLKGHLVVEEADPSFFSLSHGNAKVIREADSIFYVNQDMIISNLIIATDLASAMVVKPGKSITYNNCTMETSVADFSLTGMRGNDYVNFLMGGGDLFMQKGTLPAYTYIWGTDNSIRGNGNISGLIALQNSSASVNLDLNGSILNNISLGGGTVILDDDLYLAHDKTFLGQGTVDLNTQSLDLGAMDKMWTSTVYWDGTEGHLHLNSNVSLAARWTFSGTCIIHGYWNILELLPGAEIVVERGSNLILREVKIKDLAGYNIRCLGEDSMILYDDCKTRMSANYSFTQGRFDVQELLEIHGDFTFAYQSAQQSWIYPCTSLRMTEGTTFSYAPLCPLRDRLVFWNIKSKLELDNATLHSTATGMQILHGMLEIEGDSYLASDATVQEEGITFGDGVAAANNCIVEVLPNADLEITSGYVVNKNVV